MHSFGRCHQSLFGGDKWSAATDHHKPFLTAIYTRLKEHVDYLSEDDGDVLPSLRKSLKSKNSPNEMKLVPQVQNFNKDDYDYLLNEVGLRKATAPKHAYYPMRKIARCYTYFYGYYQ